MIRATLGWATLAVAGLAAATAPAEVQLFFAAAAIGTVGLAHGASDLAVVPRHRRSGFLAAYLAVVALVLAVWLAAAPLALAGFLLLSAVHFALDDAPADRPVERLCRGLLMVGGPALLHRAALSDLFAALVGSTVDGARLAATLTVAGAVAVVALPAVLADRIARGDTRTGVRLVAGAAALVLLPPLIGFTLGFLLLHAVPQLGERRRALGGLPLLAYVRLTAPVMAGAAAVIAATAWLFLHGEAPALSTLFAGLAALAVPHMLVTPWWQRRTAPVQRLVVT